MAQRKAHGFSLELVAVEVLCSERQVGLWGFADRRVSHMARRVQAGHRFERDLVCHRRRE
jgi:hypothetical protein